MACGLITGQYLPYVSGYPNLYVHNDTIDQVLMKHLPETESYH